MNLNTHPPAIWWTGARLFPSAAMMLWSFSSFLSPLSGYSSIFIVADNPTAVVYSLSPSSSLTRAGASLIARHTQILSSTLSYAHCRPSIPAILADSLAITDLFLSLGFSSRRSPIPFSILSLRSWSSSTNFSWLLYLLPRPSGSPQWTCFACFLG